MKKQTPRPKSTSPGLRRQSSADTVGCIGSKKEKNDIKHVNVSSTNKTWASASDFWNDVAHDFVAYKNNLLRNWQNSSQQQTAHKGNNNNNNDNNNNNNDSNKTNKNGNTSINNSNSNKDNNSRYIYIYMYVYTYSL